MTKIEQNGLAFYQSQLFLAHGFETFFFNRLGGSSQGELGQLNLSFRVGDNPARVKQNQERARTAMGADKLFTIKQVHGRQVLELDDKSDPAISSDTEADAIITSQTNAAIGVLCADCFPLLLAETERKIIAVCHCGRRGIVLGVIENTINVMIAKGGRPERMLAAIGPGICGNCYRVDEPVIEEFREKFTGDATKIFKPIGPDFLLDLKHAILEILKSQGISQDQTDDLALCTNEDPQFFSHRRSRGRAGRQLSAIMIK